MSTPKKEVPKNKVLGHLPHIPMRQGRSKIGDEAKKIRAEGGQPVVFTRHKVPYIGLISIPDFERLELLKADPEILAKINKRRPRRRTKKKKQ